MEDAAAAQNRHPQNKKKRFRVCMHEYLGMYAHFKAPPDVLCSVFLNRNSVLPEEEQVFQKGRRSRSDVQNRSSTSGKWHPFMEMAVIAIFLKESDGILLRIKALVISP